MRACVTERLRGGAAVGLAWMLGCLCIAALCVVVVRGGPCRKGRGPEGNRETFFVMENNLAVVSQNKRTGDQTHTHATGQ